ncbi:type II toxin-antitoxin system MqsA family antitoxin [Trinickia sp. EG282A]|uniref:type II toxin-antitoxin system MqsA family antitoxin n=1 Tax=Trinickia sp. EG282A TaxID=3237013 RepID=UPI0034D1946A
MKNRNCVNCGTRNGMMRFENETFTIRHEEFATQVRGLSGWRCRACEEVEFDPQSAMQYAAASDALVLKAREHTQHEIRRIRKKLHLSQAQAARLTGGGHNAFSRYESGQAMPVAAVVNLLKLLDLRPELLNVLVQPHEIELQLHE